MDQKVEMKSLFFMVAAVRKNVTVFEESIM